GGLSKDEVEKMRRDAEAHAAEDTKRKEEIEVKNTADTMAYQAEKTLRDNKDKIPEPLYKEVEGKIAAVKEALKGTDMEAVKRANQDLNETMQKVGTTIYQQQQGQQGQQPPPPGQQPPPGGKKNDDGTVEGEFHEV
ncbi:MAG: Hsp70 family protein, partial [Dehalococcoidales bacterium]|nr:Hsp70 family protein [Dehalococcoidales bacterium]